MENNYFYKWIDSNKDDEIKTIDELYQHQINYFERVDE